MSSSTHNRRQSAKAIVLAAGEGSRLRPYTEREPKCMVNYHGRRIIDYCIEALSTASLNDRKVVDEIVVVAGYLSDVLEAKLDDMRANHHTDLPPIRSCVNRDYNTTNMVHSLFVSAAHEITSAREDMADLIVSYSDIVYQADVVSRLASEARDKGAPVAIVVDRKWRELWEARMEDPLSDAETLKLHPETGHVIELGKKPSSFDEIQGQYIGLIWFSRDVLPDLVRYFKEHCADQPKMYMTSFIQGLIDDKIVSAVVPVFIDGGWTEVDTVSDLDFRLGWV